MMPAGWNLSGKAIRQEFVFDDFDQAFNFMTVIADQAESMNHHPTWANAWNKVVIVLTTHDAKGVTQDDITLASFINSLLK